MDHINEILTTQSRDLNLKPSICTALSIVKKTLNYYNKTDHSEVYQIAMGELQLNLKSTLWSNSHLLVLHPHHKLKYLEKAGWHADWISAAEGIVRAEFEHLYATLPSGTNNEESPLPESKKSKVHTGLSSRICFKPKSIAMYRTSLMISLLSQHQRPLNSMMNLHTIWALTPSWSRMYFSGGMNIRPYIHTSLAWCWTISLSQVSHTNIVLLILFTVNADWCH
jgi:hypothetical protein